MTCSGVVVWFSWLTQLKNSWPCWSSALCLPPKPWNASVPDDANESDIAATSAGSLGAAATLMISPPDVRSGVTVTVSVLPLGLLVRPPYARLRRRLAPRGLPAPDAQVPPGRSTDRDLQRDVVHGTARRRLDQSLCRDGQDRRGVRTDNGDLQRPRGVGGMRRATPTPVASGATRRCTGTSSAAPSCGLAS